MKSLRASAIKVGYLRSMLHMDHYMNTGMEDTPVMRFGRLVHMAVLEPDRKPAIWTGKQKRGKEYDSWLLEQPPGAEITTADEWAEAVACAAAVMANKDAAGLLANTAKELSVNETHPEYGPCTARFDAWKFGFLIDLKTTGRIDAHSVGRTFAQMAYHLQFGWYSMLCELAGIDKLPLCYSIVVESKPPYDCAVYQIAKLDVMAGLEECKKVAAKYRACELAGYFPGCQEKIDEVAMPEWAYREPGAPDEIATGIEW
jgi:hypothetical protein